MLDGTRLKNSYHRGRGTAATGRDPRDGIGGKIDRDRIALRFDAFKKAV